MPKSDSSFFLACKTSVSVGFSVRLRYYLLFRRAKIGPRANDKLYGNPLLRKLHFSNVIFYLSTGLLLSKVEKFLSTQSFDVKIINFNVILFPIPRLNKFLM